MTPSNREDFFHQPSPEGHNSSPQVAPASIEPFFSCVLHFQHLHSLLQSHPHRIVRNSHSWSLHWVVWFAPQCTITFPLRLTVLCLVWSYQILFLFSIQANHQDLATWHISKHLKEFSYCLFSNFLKYVLLKSWWLWQHFYKDQASQICLSVFSWWGNLCTW